MKKSARQDVELAGGFQIPYRHRDLQREPRCLIRFSTKAVLLGERVNVESVLVSDYWWILLSDMISDAS